MPAAGAGEGWSREPQTGQGSASASWEARIAAVEASQADAVRSLACRADWKAAAASAAFSRAVSRTARSRVRSAA